MEIIFSSFGLEARPIRAFHAAEEQAGPKTHPERTATREEDLTPHGIRLRMHRLRHARDLKRETRGDDARGALRPPRLPPGMRKVLAPQESRGPAV